MIASLFARRADVFEDDGFSYQERQRRQSAKEANPYRKAWRWYLSIGIPAKILVTTIAANVAYLLFVFGYIVAVVVRVAVMKSSWG